MTLFQRVYIQCQKAYPSTSNLRIGLLEVYEFTGMLRLSDGNLMKYSKVSLNLAAGREYVKTLPMAKFSPFDNALFFCDFCGVFEAPLTTLLSRCEQWYSNSRALRIYYRNRSIPKRRYTTAFTSVRHASLLIQLANTNDFGQRRTFTLVSMLSCLTKKPLLPEMASSQT